DLRAERTLPEPVIDFLKHAPKDACPMDVLRTAISMLGLYDHRAKIGVGRAAQALDYLRWLVALDPSPVNIVVGKGARALLAKPF
ncbi:MAG: citrate/2-methylcitrate synthase, partial [Hyphomicrobiales bacterium]